MADIGIKFPLEIKNKKLQTAVEAELLHSRILLLLSTYRKELLWDVRLGIPFYLFESRSNIQRDIALIEVILTTRIPDVQFLVTGDLDSNGVATIVIEYSISEFNTTNFIRLTV